MLHVLSFLHDEPLVCRVCGSSGQHCLSTSVPCSWSRGSMFTRCEEQKYPPSSSHICASPGHGPVLFWDRISSPESRRAVRLIRLGIVPCWFCWVPRGSLVPSHPQACRAGTQELKSPSLCSCRALSYGKNSCPTALVLNMHMDSG